MPRPTRQQEAILAVLRDRARPLSPQEILAAGRAHVPTLGLATVYRGVRRLVEEGAIVPVPMPGNVDRYELAEAAETHHHHFHCDACDRVYDVDGCVRGVAAIAPPGFTVTRHEIVLYGTCPRCRPTA